MKTAHAAISQRSSAGHCAVTLSASERPDLKLDIIVSGHIELQTDVGNAYSKDTIHVLCGSGLALARRRLELAGGLSVDVINVSGQLSEHDEAGVCIATAIAIARAIGKNDAKALAHTDDWDLADK